MEKEKEMIRQVAILFRKEKESIFANWLHIIKKNSALNPQELAICQDGLRRLLEDFIVHLTAEDIAGYLAGNAKIAREIAINDIPYAKFIEVFHFFEDSYSNVLKENIPADNLLAYLSAIDHLHHKTISIVSEEYFKIKDSTVFAMAKLAELKDQETAYHLERTREYSVALAKSLSLDQDFSKRIFHVGPLHDIGKIGIKDTILLKPGRLTIAEYEEMKKHTTIGAEAILSIIGEQKVSRGYLLMAVEIAGSHHEKYDGSGYPLGLKGEDIPLSARIFALADAYDAIVSKRPYKNALTHEEAVKRIRKGLGTHFDPEIVGKFLQISDHFQAIYNHYANHEHKTKSKGIDGQKYRLKLAINKK